MGLALAFALVCGWDVGQWEVPKVRARIFLVAVRWGIRGRGFYIRTFDIPLFLFPFFIFSCPCGET
jgi:hypothetical protein